MTTRLEQLDYAAKLICEADSLIREALGQNNFVSPRVSDVCKPIVIVHGLSG